MKFNKWILGLTLVTALIVTSPPLRAQEVSITNTVSTATATPTIWGGLSEIARAIGTADVLHATNYAFAPYATYAPKAPEKVGGGLLAIYNVNNYMGAAMGVDWLGHFSLISANCTLKVDTQPLRSVEWAPAWAKTITVTPFALVGVGTPLGGASGGGTTIYDIGGNVKFGHLWGGRFGVGACYGQWNNADDYSGKRYHFFLNWQKGF